MAEMHRFSSRRQRLDHSFLANRLKGAKSYRRIAGYFRSSIFELVGEEIADIPQVQIVCNSELDAADVAVSKHVRETALKERWNEAPAEVEALLHKDRYRRLHTLLTSGRVEIRVVPRDRVFVHGKAGVIEAADGSKTCFLGSINETKSAFAHNYEILWEDTSPEGVQWVEEEFEALWQEAFPLPDAIIEEIKRIADRVEMRFEEVTAAELPAAALVESPIYRGGEQLQPWQRAFVAMFLKHREIYGKTRLLLADEVGLGKTLSLAASAMLAVLLDDGPVLILCPATLTLQWQVELKDKLGIPSAVWLSAKKVWMDEHGHIIKTRGPEDITRCPFRIAIVSTGLIVHDSDERRLLLERKFGTVVLDEAHKARCRGALGEQRGEPNNLLAFMLRIGPRTKNLLLGTATPIQTEVSELWDLMRILNAGADFVLGRAMLSHWVDWHKALPVVQGTEMPVDERDAWEWLRNPLPPGDEEPTLASLRLQLGIPNNVGSLVFPGVQNCSNINKLCLHIYGSKCWKERQAMRKTFEIPLDIPEVTIQTVETDRHGDFVITVKSTVEGTSCHTCGKKITKVYGDDREITLRHLPILGRKTYIRLRPVRYQCPYCDGHPTTTQQLSWHTPKSPYTKIYETHILLELVNSTVQDVCIKEEMGYEAVMGILDRHIQGEVDWNQFVRLDVLGLDEISLKKGHRNFVTIVTGRLDDETVILGVLADRKKSTVKAFLSGMPRKLRKTIKAVCSDMYDGFIHAAQEVFGKRVRIVIDRFHVAKLYRKGLDRLRKQELQRLKQELSEEEYKQLQGVMWALRKREDHLTDEDTDLLARLFAHAPLLKTAYELCNALTEIFEKHIGKCKAKSQLTDWIERVRDSTLHCFNTFLTTLEKWMDEIANYFPDRQTSGFVEGLNNKIKVIKRRCYGILNVKHLFQRIQLDLSGYALFALKIR